MFSWDNHLSVYWGAVFVTSETSFCPRMFVVTLDLSFLWLDWIRGRVYEDFQEVERSHKRTLWNENLFVPFNISCSKRQVKVFFLIEHVGLWVEETFLNTPRNEPVFGATPGRIHEASLTSLIRFNWLLPRNAQRRNELNICHLHRTE